MRPEIFLEMEAVQQRHWWYAARREILFALIKKMKLPHAPAILEIGCGTGANLQILSQHGALSAMEYDETAKRIANELGICRVLAGCLPNSVPYEDASFDLICLLDVLEHIEDDQAALARVLRLLKPGGLLLVTVPAYQWLWSEHDVAHGHYRRYTTRDLRQKAIDASFNVEYATYFNTLLFPIVVSVRMIGKLFHRREMTGTALPGRWINWILKKTFSSERFFIASYGRFPFGISVMALLQSPA